MTDDARAATLMQKMLRKTFFAVLSKPLVAPEQLRPVLAAHLDYMIDLEKCGVIFASGPLADAGRPPAGEGLTIVRAANAAEARAIAEGDPFFKNGLRTFELKEWTVMEGMLGLRVNYSDQTIDLA
jgi:uncharacterized protein YciI